jgi:hypothetical protein
MKGGCSRHPHPATLQEREASAAEMESVHADIHPSLWSTLTPLFSPATIALTYFCMSRIAPQGVAARRYPNESCEQLCIDDASTTSIP